MIFIPHESDSFSYVSACGVQMGPAEKPKVPEYLYKNESTALGQSQTLSHFNEDSEGSVSRA